MNTDAARRVADAVLYEGYVLYPYRASAQKNRSRWQFGVLMPEAYAAVDPSEAAVSQTECVLSYTVDTSVTVLVRYLHLQRRTVARWRPDASSYEPVDALDTPQGRLFTWDEAVERELRVEVGMAELLWPGCRQPLQAPGGEQTEDIVDDAGAALGLVTRRRLPLSGTVLVSARPVPGHTPAAWLRVRVENHTRLDPQPAGRQEALPGALLAVHAIIGVSPGAFVSTLDPPGWARQHVETCTNIGAFPVLAGADGGDDVVLSAPIILYDHPEIAPESPGDMFDATEIDEILTLRTLALTDEEKAAARATDPRAAGVIDRTDAIDAQTLDRLHGAIRYLRPLPAPAPDAPPQWRDPDAPPQWRDPAASLPWWGPDVDASVSPLTDTVRIGEAVIGRGSRVLLRPGARRADAQDMFLVGRVATVEAVLLDIDDNPYLAVTLVDDPGADLARSHGRYLYFVPDEVEPCEVAQ